VQIVGIAKIRKLLDIAPAGCCGAPFTLDVAYFMFVALLLLLTLMKCVALVSWRRWRERIKFLLKMKKMGQQLVGSFNLLKCRWFPVESLDDELQSFDKCFCAGAVKCLPLNYLVMANLD
jgi:hypothetical protein